MIGVLKEQALDTQLLDQVDQRAEIATKAPSFAANHDAFPAPSKIRSVNE
jgi:hypothetical protein